MNYKVVGLAKPEDYQNYNGDSPYNQVILEEEYNLLPEYPDIREINQLIVKPIIDEVQLIQNSPRPKVLINGHYNILFQYTASKSDDPIHSFTVEKDFEIFMKIPNNDSVHRVKKVNLLLENIRVKKIHGRKFKIFILCFAYV